MSRQAQGLLGPWAILLGHGPQYIQRSLRGGEISDGFGPWVLSGTPTTKLQSQDWGPQRDLDTGLGVGGERSTLLAWLTL